MVRKVGGNMRAKIFLIFMLLGSTFSHGNNDVEPDEISHKNFVAQSPQIRTNITSTTPGMSIYIDHKNNQIKIGKCVTAIDYHEESETESPYDYCDFLDGGEGKIFDFFVNFENSSLKTLKLIQIMAKDQIVLKLNDSLVFSSTGQSSITINDVKPSSTVLKSSPNIDLTPYLREGENKLEIQVAVSDRGGYQADLRLEEEKPLTSYPCENIKHECSQGPETRLIDGVYHYKDCWQYESVKKCHYPSKNDCHLYKDCILIAERECLLEDHLGNCVNRLKEFSCRGEDEIVQVSLPTLQDIEGDPNNPATVKCYGLPCFDGVCGKPSFDKDTDILSSLSHLSIANAAKGKDLNNVKLFAGMPLKCINKVTSYSNCCKVGKRKGSGWGHSLLGAKCSPNEQHLADLRAQNLCVPIGKTKERVAGVTTLVRHHFCCWGSMLDKIIQVGGRRQLHIGFGSPENPNCEGLNVEQLSEIEFGELDFSPFYPDLINKIMQKPLGGFINSPKRPATESNFNIDTGIGQGIQPSTNDENYYYE